MKISMDTLVFGLILGLMFIASSVWAFIHQEGLISKGLETTAVVSDINRRKAVRRIYVRYTVNDVDYYNRLRIQSSGRYRGEKLDILYNPNNPNVITPIDREIATDNNNYSITNLSIGVIVILISISLMVKKAKTTT